LIRELLSVADHPGGVETGPGDHIVYDVERDDAHYGSTRVEGRALVWEVLERPLPATGTALRPVDFPPGGRRVPPHLGRGSGAIKGRIRIDTQGASHGKCGP
jgi:hypothetical protein